MGLDINTVKSWIGQTIDSLQISDANKTILKAADKKDSGGNADGKVTENELQSVVFLLDDKVVDSKNIDGLKTDTDNGDKSYSDIAKGDSAWKFYEKYAPEGRSWEQAKDDIIKANPHIYPDGNINKPAKGFSTADKFYIPAEWLPKADDTKTDGDDDTDVEKEGDHGEAEINDTFNKDGSYTREYAYEDGFKVTEKYDKDGNLIYSSEDPIEVDETAYAEKHGGIKTRRESRPDADGVKTVTIEYVDGTLRTQKVDSTGKVTSDTALEEVQKDTEDEANKATNSNGISKERMEQIGRDVVKLRSAMEGAGTDEDAVKKIILDSGYSDVELVEIMNQFKTKYGEELFQDIENDFSGGDQRELHGRLFTALQNEAIKAFGNDTTDQAFEDAVKFNKGTAGAQWFFGAGHGQAKEVVDCGDAERLVRAAIAYQKEYGSNDKNMWTAIVDDTWAAGEQQRLVKNLFQAYLDQLRK